MPNVTRSLWPKEITPEIVTPLAILKPQAEVLKDITNGILLGEVSVSQDAEQKKTYLTLDIIAPELGNYRQQVLRVSHEAGRSYPAYVEAECIGLGEEVNQTNRAATDHDLYNLVAKVLQSDAVKSLAASLIARSNEITNGR